MPIDYTDTSPDSRGGDDSSEEPESSEETAAADTESDESEAETEADPETGTDSEAENGPDDSDASYESVTDVETIVLPPEDVVQSVAYNGQEDIGRKGKAVFTLRPPFAASVEPSIRHLEDDSKSGKADDEIHIRPFRFVAEGRQVIEQRPTRSLAAEELDGDNHADATLDAWVDEAMETWKTHVRENLVDTVDIYSSHGMAFVSVEYRSED